MQDPLSLVLFAVVGLVAGALGFVIGRAGGLRDGQEQGIAAVSLEISPFTSVRPDHVEVGYTLRIWVNDDPVLEPIDAILDEETGDRIERDKEKLARLRANALGYAATAAARARKVGIHTVLGKPKA